MSNWRTVFKIVGSAILKQQIIRMLDEQIVTAESLIKTLGPNLTRGVH